MSKAIAVLHVHIRKQTKKKLLGYTAAKDQSQGSVVDAALSEYLDDAIQADLILRELGRLRRGVSRIERNMDVLDAAIAGYVQMWLAYKPPMAEDQKQHAQALAADRFDQFITFIQKQLEQQRTFIGQVSDDDLLKNEDIRALLDMEYGDNNE